MYLDIPLDEAMYRVVVWCGRLSPYWGLDVSGAAGNIIKFVRSTSTVLRYVVLHTEIDGDRDLSTVTQYEYFPHNPPCSNLVKSPPRYD